MDLSKIKVDVLMATYNGEKYISHQLDSILNQTHKNINLIIYDDCSIDNTRSILYKYKKKFKNITLILGDSNIGSTKAFEKLYNISNSEYFLFCDQDDVWLEKKIEILLKKIVETNSMLVFSDLKVVDSNLNIINNSFLNYMNYDINKIYDWKKILFGNIAPGCSMIINSKIKKYVKKFVYGKILHDYWLIIIACFLNSIDKVDEPLILYRQHNNNQIGAKKEKKINNIYDRFIINRLEMKENFKLINEFIIKNNLEKQFSLQKDFIEKYICIIDNKYNGKINKLEKIKYLSKNSKVIEGSYIKTGILLLLSITNSFNRKIK